MMDMWKWNLAFQCIFNIGVRGSENVRTRVVEADMVPVIATILDNYIKVVDKCRERAEAELRRTARLGASTRHHSSRSGEFASSSGHRVERSRRAVPPPIEIPQAFSHNQVPLESQNGDITPTPAFALSSPPERTSFTRGRPPHHHHRSHENRGQLFGAVGTNTRNIGQPLASALPTMETAETFTLRPVRDADRLPSMLPALQGEITSQPDSPTTPGAAQARQTSPRAALGRARRRPSFRHQMSMSGESDLDGQQDDLAAEVPTTAGPAVNEPIVGIQNNDINMADIVDNPELLDAGATPVPIAAPSDATDENHETFNITHRPALDGSLINPTAQTTAPIGGFSPVQPAINVVNTNPPPPWYSRYNQDRTATAGALAAMPRDEDVLMSLQLLAYVSKYCNLRSYFQKSHLVPKLKIGSDLQLLEGDTTSPTPMVEDEEELEEYELPDDFNIFPLVEKFTVRHHTADMQYWASVVMRNLCRKDDSRGGIRQCAYYQCGKWEEYTRQFAKCRRCRRTKYCSKECQKSAWVYHRHWCVAAN